MDSNSYSPKSKVGDLFFYCAKSTEKSTDQTLTKPKKL